MFLTYNSFYNDTKSIIISKEKKTKFIDLLETNKIKKEISHGVKLISSKKNIGLTSVALNHNISIIQQTQKKKLADGEFFFFDHFYSYVEYKSLEILDSEKSIC